jgi:hypothetical protein
MLTVNKEEDTPVPITVTREDGTVVTDADLSVDTADNLQASVAGGENGPLLNLKGGARLGAAMLVLQIAGGGKVASTTSVGPYSILVVGNSSYPQPGGSFGAGQSTTFTVAVFDANIEPLDNMTNPAPVATPQAGANLSTSFAPDPNNNTDWILTVTCDSQALSSSNSNGFGTTAIDITYPANPHGVPAVTVSVSTRMYILSVVSPTLAPLPATPPWYWPASVPWPPVRPAWFPIQEGSTLPIVVQVSDLWGVPIAGVTVKSALTILGAANPGALLTPSAGITNAIGQATFSLTTTNVWGDLDDVGYLADFKIGNGADPGTSVTVVGDIQ